MVGVFYILNFLGLWGVLPIHPKTFIRARHHREELEKAKLQAAQAKVEANSNEESGEKTANQEQEASTLQQEELEVEAGQNTESTTEQEIKEFEGGESVSSNEKTK